MLHFEKINNISRIHENFVETQNFINNFRNMHDELREIQHLMDADGKFDFSSRMPNLLSIHYYISQLRDVEDSARHYANQSTEDVRRTIQKHFQPLNDIVRQFDEVLFDISENLLEVVRTGDPSLVVRVAKIIDAEEKQDLTTRIVEEIKEDNAEESSGGTVTSKSIVGRKGAEIHNNIRRSIIGQKGSGPYDLSKDLLNNNTATSGSSTSTVTTSNSTKAPDKKENQTTSKPARQNIQNLMGSIKDIHRIRRNYPEKFFAAIEKSIHSLFEGCMETFSGNPDEILDNLDWIYTDLQLTQQELVKCTPARWNIFDKFVTFYHKELYAMLNQILDTDPNALVILKILNYVKEYYTTMENVMGVPRDPLLNPPLLDGKEDKLYDDYLDLIKSKLREWKTNLGSTEKVNFIERAVPPESDEDNRLGLQGEYIMFTIISQQIDVAAESGQARILVGTIEECGSILRERQDSWEKTMREQVKLQLEDSTDGKGVTNVDGTVTGAVPGGLVEYLLALANDQIKGADHAEHISSKTAGMVSKKYRNQVTSTWDFVSDGFINLAKECIACLITIIFNDLKPACDQLFAKSTWYKGKPVKQICDTIAEYTADFKTYLNPIIFDVYVDELLEGTIMKYLSALQNPNSSLSAPKGTEQIKKDVEAFYILFEKNYDNPEHVQLQFRVFEHLLATLEAPLEELPSMFLNLRQDFWDAPLELFEAMVRARKDIDSKAAREIIATVRNQALHQSEQPVAHQQPTFVSDFSKSTKS